MSVRREHAEQPDVTSEKVQDIHDRFTNFIQTIGVYIKEVFDDMYHMKATELPEAEHQPDRTTAAVTPASSSTDAAAGTTSS